jgi:hypothetical protein
LKAFPSLAFIDRDSGLVDEGRMSKCFKTNVVSLRLVLFNIWFLQHVAKAPHTHGDGCCANASCAMVKYSLTKGLPGASLCLRLQAACRRIYGLSSWTDFFSGSSSSQAFRCLFMPMASTLCAEFVAQRLSSTWPVRTHSVNAKRQARGENS